MSKSNLRKQISQHVSSLFPGCAAEFCGQQGHAAKVFAGQFGFRVKDSRTGKHRSNIVWVNDYDGEINEAWVKAAVKDSNG